MDLAAIFVAQTTSAKIALRDAIAARKTARSDHVKATSIILLALLPGEVNRVQETDERAMFGDSQDATEEGGNQ